MKSLYWMLLLLFLLLGPAPAFADADQCMERAVLAPDCVFTVGLLGIASLIPGILISMGAALGLYFGRARLGWRMGLRLIVGNALVGAVLGSSCLFFWSLWGSHQPPLPVWKFWEFNGVYAALMTGVFARMARGQPVSGSAGAFWKVIGLLCLAGVATALIFARMSVV